MIARILDLVALLILLGMTWISYDLFKQGYLREAAISGAISIVLLLVLRFVYRTGPCLLIEEKDE